MNQCDLSQELEEMDQTVSLALPTAQIQRIQDVAAEDPIMSMLRDTVRKGWPSTKSGIAESLYPYFDVRDELTLQDSLIFKGQQLEIPAAMRREMMSRAHASHIGIEGCIRRARETMYWPRMSSELKEFISKCDVCMAYRNTPTKEPISQHGFAA